ncbi:unnamed protein product [Absidia cylindrospora]
MFSSFKSSCAAMFGKPTTPATSITTNNNKNNSSNNINNSKTNSNSNNNRIDQGYEMVYVFEEPWSFHFVDQWDYADFHFVGGDWLGVSPLAGH